MSMVCPAVLAGEPHEFREQMEKIAHFAERVQIDLTDGLFAQKKTISLNEVWWPHSLHADLHLMYKRPDLYLDTLVELSPSMVIVHAEAEGEFGPFAEKLHMAGIDVGVALLPETSPELIETALDMIDHVMIFSGHLGHFGGKADLDLLKKVHYLMEKKPLLEIGWDGGVNEMNARQLARGGVDVLNVGGYIHGSDDPQAAYATLITAIEGQEPA